MKTFKEILEESIDYNYTLSKSMTRGDWVVILNHRMIQLPLKIFVEMRDYNNGKYNINFKINGEIFKTFKNKKCEFEDENCVKKLLPSLLKSLLNDNKFKKRFFNI